ncbi:hypothetical protein ACFS4T_11855 [Pseudomonas lini]
MKWLQYQKANPSDPRLMRRAVGVSNLEDVLYRDSIWAALGSLVEDAFSGAIADTNATGFTIENLEISSADYDETNGMLTLEVYFEYQGEQDLDRVWHGSEFYVDAQIQLIFFGMVGTLWKKIRWPSLAARQTRIWIMKQSKPMSMSSIRSLNGSVMNLTRIPLSF